MKNIAIFASGSGTNAENIALHFTDNQTAEVVLIVSNKKTSGVLKRAEKLKIDHIFVDKKKPE